MVRERSGIPPAQRAAGIRIVYVAIEPFRTGVCANEVVKKLLDRLKAGAQRDGEDQAPGDSPVESSRESAANLGGKLFTEGLHGLAGEYLHGNIPATTE